MIVPSELTTRRAESARRLGLLSAKLTAALSERVELANVCIYATGSYGRGEAGATSDIDLFFLDAGEPPAGKLAGISLMAQVIDTCHELDFPEFSHDGEYLEVHQLKELTDELGSPEEDAANFFTARLLLLLESKPVYNEAAYNTSVKHVAAAYFRDFPSRETNFRPAFLINDVVRFWKTLCLNYEHRRGAGTESDANAQSSVVTKFKNLKLAFVRLMTCYSLVVGLSFDYRRRGGTTPADLLRLVSMSPSERLEDLAAADSQLAELVTVVLEKYSWFLATLGGIRIDSERWLDEQGNREVANREVDAYLNAYFALLTGASSSSDIARFIMM